MARPTSLKSAERTLFDPPEIAVPQRRGTSPMAQTSLAANVRRRSHLREDYRIILRFLRDHGPGVHDDICAAGQLVPQTSGRMGELVKLGWIEVVGTGITRSGSAAKKCAITQDGRKILAADERGSTRIGTTDEPR